MERSDPSPRRPTTTSPSAGEIETSSVPELLRSLLGSGETGVLTFRNGDVTKSIYIHSGRVVYAASNNVDERLGECLLVRGKITVRQYLEASKLIRPGPRLGAILVELEALEPEELMPAVEHQVKEILMDLFTWTRGDYELVIKELDPDERGRAQHLHGEPDPGGHPAHAGPGARSPRGIGDIETVFVPTGNTEVLYKLELTEEEQEILAHVNGRATVEQICEVSYLSNFETCRILWALQVLGVIRRGQAEDAAALGEDDARARARARPRGDRREVQPDVQPHLLASCRAGSGDERGRVHGRGAWRRSRGSTGRSSTAST